MVYQALKAVLMWPPLYKRYKSVLKPHPTLSETVAMAAEAFEGSITDLYMPKRK